MATGNNIRWCEFPGQRLVKEVTINVGGICSTTYHVCEKCGKAFEWDGKDVMEFRRAFSYKEGNLKLCYRCDRNIPKPISGYNDLIGQK